MLDGKSALQLQNQLEKKDMKYQINENADGLRIQATGSPEQQKTLLNEFQKCAAGTCSCPSTQYEKLQSIDVTPNATGLTVQLKAKSGDVIDRQDIERCLDHTSNLIQG
jgi:hypothetical protein